VPFAERHGLINELIGILKDRLIIALVQELPKIQALMVDSILDEIKHYVALIRPFRSTPRKSSSRNCKFYHNKKVNC
jgi:hypothetical protein